MAALVDRLLKTLNAWLLAALRQGIAWLDAAVRYLDPPVPVPLSVPLTPAQVSAGYWVQWADVTYPLFSGEYKRHKVYAKLIKEFPRERRRVLGFAIEHALERGAYE